MSNQPLPYKQRMSLTDEALAGLPSYTNDTAKFQGQHGYWVQGDAVFIPCSNAGTAISFYRQRFNAGDIGAAHNLATAAVGRMKAAQALDQFKQQVTEAFLKIVQPLGWHDGQEYSGYNNESRAVAEMDMQGRILDVAQQLGIDLSSLDQEPAPANDTPR